MNNLNTCNDSQLKDCELLDKYHDSGYNKLIITDWGYIVKLAVYGYGFVNISFNKAEREQMVKVFSGDFNIPVSITKDGKNLKYNQFFRRKECPKDSCFCNYLWGKRRFC